MGKCFGFVFSRACNCSLRHFSRERDEGTVPPGLGLGGGQGRRRLDGSISSQDMRRRKIGTRKIGRRCLLSHATGN